ncbi:hypothetical protein [Simkania negevensis]|uniref:hypothetical protein n=1 Tax=Simkania negevensis TaxID=83561 RepID=UPI0011D18ADA|nr:hypothetical protein [Simkania negevensis]
MASQIPSRPSQRSTVSEGWGFAGAGRLASSVYQKGYSFIASLGGSLLPFFFTQNFQNPSVGTNDGQSDSVLKNRSLHVRTSTSSDLRLVSGLKDQPELMIDESQTGESERILPKPAVKRGEGDNPKSDGPTLLETAVKTDRVAQKEMKEPWWLITGPSNEFIYATSDISSLYRMVHGVQLAVTNQPTPPGDTALGITSAASILTGYVAGCRGYVQDREASKIGDFWGQVSGKVTMARGAFETTYGAAMLPTRILSLVAASNGSQSVAQAAAVSGNVASALGGVMYLLLAIPCAISVGKGIQFKVGLNEAMNDPEFKTESEKLRGGIDYIMGKLVLNRDDRRELATKVACDPSIWDGENVTPVDISAADEKLLSQGDKDYIQGFAGAYGKKHDYSEFTIAQIGEHIKSAFINGKKLKEAELGRMADPATVKLVKDELEKPKAEQLLERLLDPNDKTAVQDAEAFLNQVNKNANFNIAMNATILILCILGAVAFFAGMAVTGGGLGIALSVIWVVVSIGMLAVDGYYLWQAYKSGDPKFGDKVMMSLMGLFMTASVMTAVFSGGLVPLIAAGVIGLMWAGTGIYSYYRWSKEPVDEEKTDKVAQEKIALLKEEERRLLAEKEHRRLEENLKEKLA